MSGRFSRTIYVGNLPADIREVEIEELFYKYGRILDIELKIPPRPPCYCFVEFESSRDAEDAIRGRDGYNFDGCRLRVELAHGGRGQPSSSDRRGSYGGGGGGGGSGRFGISRHSEFRGTFGIVDYTNYEDMKYAIRKLDDTEFRNPWARAYIRTKVRVEVTISASGKVRQCVTGERGNLLGSQWKSFPGAGCVTKLVNGLLVDLIVVDDGDLHQTYFLTARLFSATQSRLIVLTVLNSHYTQLCSIKLLNGRGSLGIIEVPSTYAL
ncbi:hypothetical protein CDL15_Pgr023088 [Punica granatum]|uniref:RRM domain-containing protein n=1 Tax=Punica granatum TaxID=22663 RepID=A0A218X4Q7_PUNGR|nr:hypothetical protein CDL15_Pgr023088 [Punica granatum]